MKQRGGCRGFEDSSPFQERDRRGREEEVWRESEEEGKITIGPISLPWGRKTKRREYVEQVQVSTTQSQLGRETNWELLGRI